MRLEKVNDVLVEEGRAEGARDKEDGWFCSSHDGKSSRLFKSFECRTDVIMDEEIRRMEALESVGENRGLV